MEGIYIRTILAVLFFFNLEHSIAGSSYDVYQNSSGLYVVSHQEATKTVSIQLYFRIGVAYEIDSFKGVTAFVQKMLYDKFKEQSVALNYTVNQVVEPEITGFTFDCSPDKTKQVMSTINAVLVNFNCTENDITGYSIVIDENPSKQNEISSVILKKLWSKDFDKVSTLPKAIHQEMLSPNSINSFYSRHFQTSNAMLCINSPMPKSEVETLVDMTFHQSGLTIFNPEKITHVLEFKPIVNYTHFNSINSGITEEASIIFQNPGARYDRKGSYCGYILTQILENEILGDSLRASYKSNNYFGTFALSVPISNHKYKTAQFLLKAIVDKIQNLDFLQEDKISKAKDLIINEYRNLAISGPVFFMKEMAYYRFTHDENYILSFADSIKDVTVKDMKWYINDYFVNRAGVMYTVSNSNPTQNTDTAERVYTIDGNFQDVKCMYDLNKTDLSSDSNWVGVYKVINWLQINADAHVQINGFADEAEYNRVKDDALQRFIDSIPTFKKAMPDFIKTGNMRPETMRALKLMKVFYENGIDLKRITGTSMLFTSDSKEKAIENRKCTFTINKIKPTIFIHKSLIGQGNIDITK